MSFNGHQRRARDTSALGAATGAQGMDGRQAGGVPPLQLPWGASCGSLGGLQGLPSKVGALWSHICHPPLTISGSQGAGAESLGDRCPAAGVESLG